MRTRRRTALAIAVVLAVFLLPTSFILSSALHDQRPDVRKAFDKYRAAIVARDPDAALAVTTPDSVTYFGQWFRDHALYLTREELEEHSAFQQTVILVYRAKLGADFLRTASPQDIYKELVRQHLVILNPEFMAPGDITIDARDHAEAPVALNGKDTGASVYFSKVHGTWLVNANSHAGYMYGVLREAQEQSGKSKHDVVCWAFKRTCGVEPADDLWEKPE